MNIHYVLWVAISVAVTASIYATYSHILDVAVNQHADILEETLAHLINVEPGGEKRAVIAIPRDVKLSVQPQCPTKSSSGDQWHIVVTRRDRTTCIPLDRQPILKSCGKHTCTIVSDAPPGVYELTVKSTIERGKAALEIILRNK